MNPEAFDAAVYGSALDDYEAPHTIASDLARDLGTPLTEQDVLAAFIRLVEAGRVIAYRYGVSCGRFEPTDITSASADGVWFLSQRT